MRRIHDSESQFIKLKSFCFLQILVWFHVNKKTGNVDANEISRKNQAFNDMQLYQAQIQIEIVCGKPFASRNTTEAYHSRNSQHSKINPDGNLILTDEVKRIGNILLVNVDIENSDNHPPVFLDPSPYYVGYPNSQLANIIQPNYVYQLKVSIDSLVIGRDRDCPRSAST